MSTFQERIKEVGTDFEQKRATLLVGPSGVGKTHQCRTLIEGGMNVLYVSTEMKQASISDLKFDTFHVKTYDFPISAEEKTRLTRTNGSDVIDLFDFLRKEDHGYDVCYFDSIMRYARKQFEYLRNTVKSKGGAPDTLRAYGLLADKMQAFLDIISQVTNGGTAKHPVHFIGTWGVEIGTDWQGKRRIQPIMDGKVVGPVIDYHFDDVFMLGCDEDISSGDQSFVLSTMGTKEYDAKRSSHIKIPARISNPNLFNIIEVLQGNADAKILS